jgi:hypothetical protein
MCRFAHASVKTMLAFERAAPKRIAPERYDFPVPLAAVISRWPLNSRRPYFSGLSSFAAAQDRAFADDRKPGVNGIRFAFLDAHDMPTKSDPK